jgi:hypothetical protein
MRVLSLDLGVTTGWAVHYRFGDGGAALLGNGILSYSTYTTSLPTILRVWDIDHVALEMPLLVTRGQLRSQLDNVIAWTMSAIGDLPRTEFYASDWKPTAYAKKKVPRGTTTHERDAIRMGMWFTETRLQGS